MSHFNKRIIYGAAFIALLLSFIAFPAPAQTADDSASFQTLMERLRERNMPRESLREFESEAARFGWSEVRELDPKRLAYALEYCLAGEDRLESPLRARLAFELALQMREMTRLGYSEHETLGAAFRGAREVAENPPVRGNVSDDAALRDQIRDRLRTRLRTEAHGQLQTQQRPRTGSASTAGQGGAHGAGQAGRR